MTKFMIFYRGPATKSEDMPEGKMEEIMKAWKKWMDDNKDNIEEVGSPLKACASVVDDGSEGECPEISGYSCIKAKDLDEAKNVCKDHPFLSDKSGKFCVDIFEVLPDPKM